MHHARGSTSKGKTTRIVQKRFSGCENQLKKMPGFRLNMFVCSTVFQLKLLTGRDGHQRPRCLGAARGPAIVAGAGHSGTHLLGQPRAGGAFNLQFKFILFNTINYIYIYIFFYIDEFSIDQ